MPRKSWFRWKGNKGDSISHSERNRFTRGVKPRNNHPAARSTTGRIYEMQDARDSIHEEIKRDSIARSRASRFRGSRTHGYPVDESNTGEMEQRSRKPLINR